MEVAAGGIGCECVIDHDERNGVRFASLTRLGWRSVGRAGSGEALGLGLDHGTEGVMVEGALLLQVGTDLGERVVVQRFVHKCLVGHARLASVPPSAIKLVWDVRPPAYPWPVFAAQLDQRHSVGSSMSRARTGLRSM